MQHAATNIPDALRQKEASGRCLMAERLVLWWIPAAMTAFFLFLAYLKIRYFQVNDWDFSYFLTQPWRIFQGLDAKTPFAGAYSEDFYAVHFTPLSLVLAPVIGLLPSAYTLAALHALATGFMSFLLPRLARAVSLNLDADNDRGEWLWVAAFLLGIFLFFPPWTSAFNYMTHYTTLASPFVALALLCLLKSRPALRGVSSLSLSLSPLFYLSCLMLLLAQERASVAIFGIGMFAFLLAGRPRLGLALCLLSACWFFGVVKLLLPFLRKWAGLSDGYFFGRYLMPLALLPQKIRFLLDFLPMTLFLPLCGKKAFLSALCALPVLGVSLASSRAGMISFHFMYQDLVTPFLFVSMVYGCFWVARQGRRFASLQKRWVLVSALALLLAVYAVMTQQSKVGYTTPFSIYRSLVNHEQRTALDALNEDIRIFDKLPEDVMFYAQSGLGPRLALRRHRYLARESHLEKAASEKSVLAFSPICGAYHMGNDTKPDNVAYAEAMAKADRTPGLSLLGDNGRLRVYAGRRFLEEEPDLAREMAARLARP